MTEGTSDFGWRVIGCSVRGASHIRSGLPNQDEVGWQQYSGSLRSLIVAASDGHGSAKYFRSHIGSRLAVEVALTLGQEFLGGQPDLKSFSAIKRTAEERLPQEMARRWKDAVNGHFENNPFSTEELDALEKQDGLVARETIASNPTRAYGATILTVLVTETFIFYLQLGDGDIMLVTDAGEVERPLPKDERLFANETTSLSSENAWPDFRFGFQILVDTPPALILISTDGYANSFVSEEAFLKVGGDILKLIRSDGVDEVDRNLEAWLAEASHAGSGDDTTLAIICRMEVMRKSDGGMPVKQTTGVQVEVTGDQTETTGQVPAPPPQTPPEADTPQGKGNE
jgi:serine/threonine protein phosphatase PrpC